MRLSRNRLPGWLLSVALALVLCFGLWWWWLSDLLIALLAQGVTLVSPYLWPETVLDIKLQGNQPWIISLVPTLSDPPQLFTLMPLILTRAVAIFPLFWGLTLATPGRGLLRRLLLGTLYLLPVALGMALLTTQFQFALYRTHLPLVTLVPLPHFVLELPDSPAAYYAWGVGRQLATLILPLIAPLLVWLGLHERFLSHFFPQGFTRRQKPLTPLPTASPAAEPPAPPSCSGPATTTTPPLDPGPATTATPAADPASSSAAIPDALPLSATRSASAVFPPPTTPFVPPAMAVNLGPPPDQELPP